jgi:hypothetical protein
VQDCLWGEKNVGQRLALVKAQIGEERHKSSHYEERMSNRVKRTNSLRENLIGQSKLKECNFRILTNNPVLLHERLLS